MFLGVGVGAFSAGIFHLMTHAFFKALLFLGAGAVIHGLHGEQDLRQMGGLFKHMKITAITLFCASLAISGLPLSRPASSARTPFCCAAYARAPWMYWVGVFTAGHDGVLRFSRLVHGLHRRVSRPRASARIAAGDDRSADDARGLVARAAASSTCRTFWSRCSPRRRPKIRCWHGLSAGVGILGILLAFVFYVATPGLPDSFAKAMRRPLHVWSTTSTSSMKLYDALGGAAAGGWFAHGAVARHGRPVIDGTVNGVGAGARGIGAILRLAQSGYIRSYAAWVVLGSIAAC